MTGERRAGLRVEPGEVLVGEALLVVDEPRAKVWEVDLGSKYAEVLSSGTDPQGRLEVLVMAGGRTQSIDIARKGIPTRILLDDLEQGGPAWSLLAQASRYTLRVLAYLPSYPDDRRPRQD